MSRRFFGKTRPLGMFDTYVECLFRTGQRSENEWGAIERMESTRHVGRGMAQKGLWFVLQLLIGISAGAEVRLPALLADHMVVQRDRPVHFWGRANVGEAVSVTFKNNSAATTADSIGLWSLYLPPVEAGGPFEITVTASNRIVIHDVLVGDVWVASGQSNMGFPLRDAANAAAEIASAKYPRIRLINVESKVASYPLDDFETKGWSKCSPETAGNFSAVAYFFGRDLHQKTNVPIGLIESAWGGTPAEAWTSLRALSADASLMPVFAQWAKLSDDSITLKARRKNELDAWREQASKAKAEGQSEPDYPWQANVDAGEWQPAGLFNGMIAPLVRFPIRGVIWYQGESNAAIEQAPIYARLFKTLIQDWRRAWGEGDFPFLFVQLASFQGGPDVKWAEVRDAQRRALALRNTGMAVILDLGEETRIHPRNKQDVGLRLALAARAMAYGENIEYSGPLFRQAVAEQESIRVFFDHSSSGLVSKGGELKRFEIAGDERNFVPAEAHIDGSDVVVSSPSVPHPAFVRYGWANFSDCNLYNQAGLPASPFQSAQ
jgi:sialate O-acetylesterase